MMHGNMNLKNKKNSMKSKVHKILILGIKVSCINKRKLFLISRNSNDRKIKNYYKKYGKVLADVIKLARKIHYNNLLVKSSNKTGTTWNIINENINKRPRGNDISFININGTTTHNRQVIANTFNTYFVAVAQHIQHIHTENSKNSNSVASDNNPPNYLYNAFKQPIPAIKLIFVSSKEIEDIVRSFKTKDSHGYDGISIKILKLSIPCISSLLTYLCNLMISTGMFPTRLKFAEIEPLYKKGEMANISNYGPICLMTSFSKIFEKIIFTRLIHHLNYNHILVEDQFGYRAKSSMDLASYKLINDILTSLNNKLLV
jgi:hypothetical protein